MKTHNYTLADVVPGAKIGAYTVLETYRKRVKNQAKKRGGYYYVSRFFAVVRCACGSEPRHVYASSFVLAVNKSPCETPSCRKCTARPSGYKQRREWGNIGAVSGVYQVIGEPTKDAADKTLVHCRCLKCGHEHHIGTHMWPSSARAVAKMCAKCPERVTPASRHPLGVTHSSMMHRCYNPKNRSYHRYGGRGVTVCQEWHTFYKFAQWIDENLGKCPPKHSLDKINNNNKGYEPGNVRWAPPPLQTVNRECIKDKDEKVNARLLLLGLDEMCRPIAPPCNSESAALPDTGTTTPGGAVPHLREIADGVTALN